MYTVIVTVISAATERSPQYYALFYTVVSTFVVI
jgi:hypothetical protein